jgi:NAD(P)-dependent dehydrogenase (short-subunit alcohol dehydrogenase family)
VSDVDLSQQMDQGANGIDGQVIAITGASGGIGRATALHLARIGGKIVLGHGMNNLWRRWQKRLRPPGAKASVRAWIAQAGLVANFSALFKELMLPPVERLNRRVLRPNSCTF